jgi:hypothetical protein
LGVVLAAAVLLGGLLLARLLAARDPLRQAWSAAAAAGSYRVAGTTHARVGELAATYALSGTGRSDGRLELAIRPPGPEGATTTYDIDWPRVTGPPGGVQPQALALVLPVGDPLALLAVAHAPAAGPLEAAPGELCRRVDFRVGGRAYARWWSDHRRYLPVNADSGGLNTLTGSGTVWLDPRTHRPCRIAARLDLPRLAGEQPGIGEVDWVYSAWGEPSTAWP